MTTTTARMAIPLHYVSPKAPAALALREAKDVLRQYSINKHVRPYTGPIFVGVFS